MKKLIASLLALCMLLAVLPALAEGPAGTWYITLADVTLGHFALNEDGTAQVQLPGQDEMTGPWAADDAVVTITIDGQSIPFAYDGSTLASDMLPLPIGLEEGKLSMDLISKMMNGEEYELPEGLTDLDMMTIAANFMAEYQKLMGAVGVDGGSGIGVAPEVNPELTVLSESFKVIESYSGFRGVYIAKVRNDNDMPVFIRGGSMTVTDAKGNQAGEATYMASTGSRYLEPGEVSFYSMNADLAEDGEYTFTPEVEVSTEGYRTDRPVTVAETSFVPAEGYNNAYMRATVVNDTDEMLAGLRVVYALTDAEGTLIDLRDEELYRHELGANSTIVMVTSMDGKTQEYCAAKGIEPANVEAYAWIEIDN